MWVVYDHTYPEWDNKRTKVNGAYTYSKDICKFYLPHIQSLGKRTLVSTAVPLYNSNFHTPLNDCELVVQFFHKFPYEETNMDEMVSKLLVWLKVRAFNGKLIIVSSYKSFCDYINLKFNIDAVFFNMTVDVDELPIQGNDVRMSGVWFGNSYAKKNNYKLQIINEFNKINKPIDILQDGNYNFGSLGNRSPHDVIRHYKWGVGVGRCALEMLAIGLNVMISGEYFGGMVTNEDDFLVQSNSNFNGRQITYDRVIHNCIRKIGDERQRLVDVDFVRSTIKGWINQNIQKIYEKF